MRRLLMLAALLALPGASALAQSAAPPPTVTAQVSQPSGPSHSAATPVPTERRYLVQVDSGPGPAWWTYFVQIVGPIVSGVIAFAGVLTGSKLSERSAARTITASNWQKANEAELAEIHAKVEGFYASFKQLSDLNLLLAEDLKSRQPDHADFRLLIALFDGGWRGALSAGDAEIVHQIRDNGERLEKLILEKAGSVDAVVLPYLTRAGAHFRILRLAYDRALGSDPTPFKRYVYPRALDEVLDLELSRLRDRMTALRSAPAEKPVARPGPEGLPPLDPWV